METNSSTTIALLTDFGLQDTYVGVMKAVMRCICPVAEFIDLTHSIQPQNVKEAALALMSACDYFPPSTTFLVVVDPGVGSIRRPMAVEAGKFTFVAPDNGVLSYVLANRDVVRAFELANPDYQVQPVSQTFHGRDIFAPAAAHLAAGVPIKEFGPSVTDLHQLPLPELVVGDGTITGEIVHIDHFGNAVTSIGALSWVDSQQLILTPRFTTGCTRSKVDAARAVIAFNGQWLTGLKRTFSEVNPGELLALVGSSGFLELAMNQGNGAARLGASIGDRVEVRL